MNNEHKPYGLYERYFKRLLDVICAAAAIILFSWLYLVLAVMVRIKLGAPVIFRQERPGLRNRIFKLYKFRTMTDERDENGELLPDRERLTPFGGFLRASSLDELPELWNILKGEMSIVGPRPLAVQYLDYYTEEEIKRHLVRPGLTGLAQINGRNAITWEEKFAFDLKYIDEITFLHDIKIILQTIIVTVKRKDIGERGTDGQLDFDIYRKNNQERKV